MGNNGNKLRRKKVLVCLVGGYTSAIITITITFDKVFDVKQNKKRFSLEISN